MRASVTSARAISTICWCATLSRTDERAGVERDAQVVEHRLSLPAHLRSAKPEAARLAPEKDVVRDGKIRNERELLVDDADAPVARCKRSAGRQGSVLELDFAAIGNDCATQDLDERGFAGAILADERADLASADLEVEVGEHGDAAVRLREAPRPEKH